MEMASMGILFLGAIAFIVFLACLVPIAFLPWRRASRGSSD
jgi:hypothetical protein